MRAVDPYPKPRSRSLCLHCGATPGACRGRLWFSGRTCCESCLTVGGDHDGDGDGAA